jgi:uncharacterized protein (UPF0332 family)
VATLPEQLLKQARALATLDARGRPAQANLRRAVSSAYYALFHRLVERAVGDLVRGAGVWRRHLRWALSRAFDHAQMKTVSQRFAGQPPTALSAALGAPPLQPRLRSIAQAVVDLQQARHDADYDLTGSFARREVLDLVGRAERAFDDIAALRNSRHLTVYLVALLAGKQAKWA